MGTKEKHGGQRF